MRNPSGSGFESRTLYLIVDGETMPNWFSMPEDADLPSAL